MKLFKINKNCAFIIVMSMLSGFPSNAKYTKELYKKGLINVYEASKILAFSFFSNPLFILGTVSITFLGNKEIGILILFCHYITNIIIGLIFRNYHPTKDYKEKINIMKVINNLEIKNNNFGLLLTDIINSAIKTLFLILGIVTISLIFTTIINQNISLNNFNIAILNGFIEMTQGLKYISLLSIPLCYKATISCMLISFGGISVHLQVISIISDTEIKYFPFLTARIIHSFISSFLCYILFNLIY